MDRRFHQRFPTDLPVLLTPLDSDLQIAGQLEDISDSGICSFFPEFLDAGVIVKLEILGLTLFGHIVYSSPEGELFRTGVFVEPALLDSSNLTELVQNFIISAAGRD
ncbi:MAG TPA: PilZ domain-containing protein [Bryobacteraceae bacterium]|nr:PilZ domain-containing protein [Bryobacteraceae bacterium]